jgi:hypothetical protein
MGPAHRNEVLIDFNLRERRRRCDERGKNCNRECSNAQGRPQLLIECRQHTSEMMPQVNWPRLDFQ